MTVQGVDHIQLPIPIGAAAQARAFYEGLLGLSEVRHPALDKPGTLRFSLGWQRLDLSEGFYTGVAPQAHLALSVQGLAAIVHRLRQAGVPFEEAPLDDVARLYVEDPFGTRLELIDALAGISHQHHTIADVRLSV